MIKQLFSFSHSPINKPLVNSTIHCPSDSEEPDFLFSGNQDELIGQTGPPGLRTQRTPTQWQHSPSSVLDSPDEEVTQASETKLLAGFFSRETAQVAHLLTKKLTAFANSYVAIHLYCFGEVSKVFRPLETLPGLTQLDHELVHY